MLFALYEDDAYSTLASPLAAGGSSATVVDGSVYPSPSTVHEYFYATIRRTSDGAKETVKCSATSGNVITISDRAQGTGEVALDFIAGDSVIVRWGKDLLDDLESEDVYRNAIGIAGLRLRTGIINQAIWVAYHTTAQDGGAGWFCWDATSSAADDDGITVLPTGHVGAGRWIREFTGSVNAAWYGCAVGVAAGTNTTAIQAAIDFAATNLVQGTRPTNPTATGNAYISGAVFVDLPSGILQFTQLSLQPGVILRGQGSIGTILETTTTGNAIVKTALAPVYGENDSGLWDLTLRAASGVTSATGINAHVMDLLSLQNMVVHDFDVIGIHLRQCQYMDARDIQVHDCGIGICFDRGDDLFPCSNNSISNLRCWGNTTGVQMLYSSAAIINSGTIQNNSSVGVDIAAGSISTSLRDVHFEDQADVGAYDIEDQGTVTSLIGCYFVISGIETERRILCSGRGLTLLGCYTQQSDPATVRSSKAIFTVDGPGNGTLQIYGGQFTSTIHPSQLCADLAADSETAALSYVSWHGFEFAGWFSLGRNRIYLPAGTSVAEETWSAGDTVNRWRIDGNGKMDWGSGAGATDITLARQAAGVLKTTGKLTATVGLGVGNSAAATTPGSVTKKIEVFDANGTSLGFLPVYDAIT